MLFPIRALAISLLPCVAFGHHSQAFYSNVFSEMEGELVAVEWRNPHIRIVLRTVNSTGDEVLQRIETNSIYYLRRAGTSKDRVQVGDRVNIGGYAAKEAGGDFLGAEIVLADGQHHFLLRDVRGEVASQFKDQIQDTVAEDRGIFRVWSIPKQNDRELHIPLTEAAIAKAASFDPLDNFSTRCEPAGMPRLMWYPHPYEFVDEGDKILLRIEMYDTVRTIHLDQAAVPENEPFSRLGYSIGRWEDNVLVVNTTHLNWNFYDTRGVPQSDAAEVVERFTLSDDQSRLDYFITTTDPETLTEPATIAGHWLALGEEIVPYECDL
jgi:hypothetical protein